MIERTLTVVPEDGLHARPASALVEAANASDSTVTVAPVGGEAINAGSMLAVTGLGVAGGDDVVLTVDGPDEAETADRIDEILSTPETDEED